MGGFAGHWVCVSWDRDGTKYNAGVGLNVFVDGVLHASRPTLGKLEVSLDKAHTV